MFRNIKNNIIGVLLIVIGILLYLLHECSYGRYCIPIIKDPPPFESKEK